MSDCGFAHVVICEEYDKQTKGGVLAKIEEDSCVFLGNILFLHYHALLRHASAKLQGGFTLFFSFVFLSPSRFCSDIGS